MKAYRPQHVIVGLHLDDPVPELPLLRHCGDEVCSRHHRISRHKHDRFEFCYVSEGAATWKMGQEVVRQNPGEMLIAFPEQWHQLLEDDHGVYHILYAAVEIEKLGPLGQALARQLLDRRIHLVKDAQESETVLRSLVRQAASRQPMRAMVAESLLQSLVALTLQGIASGAAGASGEKGAETTEGAGVAEGLHSYPVQAAIAYLRAHADRRVAAADLAQVANFSPGHFVRVFKKEVGVTPAEFHLRLRLEAARDELRQPDFSVTDAAVRFGFSSSQHFSRAFRAMFRMTPRAWQRL